MNDTSRWWALDLVLVVVLADLAGAAIYLGAPAAVRIPLALALVLLLPGYALTAVVFPATNRYSTELASLEDRNGGLLNPLPSNYEVDGAERLALSTAFSIAIVPSVAAVANFTPWGVTLGPILGGVVAVTVALAALAFLRRLRLPPDARFAPSPASVVTATRPFRRRGPLFADSGRVGTFNRAAAVGLLLVVASVGYALAAPPAGPEFTEFYVVTDDATGSASTPYPATFESGDTSVVPVGIANHEGEAIEYTIVVALSDPGADGGGASGGGFEEIGRHSATVADGETSEVSVDVRPTRSGDARLLFLLYRGEPPSDPSRESAYRVLDLSIDVSGDAAASQGGT